MPTLVFSDVDGVDRAFELGTEPAFIGRGLECAIRSDDPRVSRIHARLFVEPSGVWIEDMGSSNGVFVGPQKITRALVPIAEVVIIGSIMMRMLAQDGTMPPPMGVHGTLAQWLMLERRSRSAVEQERNAFVKRVGELSHDVQVLVDAHHAHTIGHSTAEIIKSRDAAVARATGLQRALTSVKQELAANAAQNNTGMDQALFEAERRLTASADHIAALEQQLRDVKVKQRTPDSVKHTQQIDKLKELAEKANIARAQVEQTAAAERAEANKLRHELEQLRKSASRDQDALKAQLAKAAEERTLSATGAGVVAAEQLAHSEKQHADLADLAAQVSRLTEQLANATPGDFNDRILILEQRAEKAEKKAAAAQVQAQGAQRNVAEANVQTAAAQKQVADWKTSASTANAKVVELGSSIATLTEQLAQAQQQLTAGLSAAATDGKYADTADIAALQAEHAATQASADKDRKRLQQALAEQELAVTTATTQLATAQTLAISLQQRASSAEQQCIDTTQKLKTAEQMLLDQSDASEQILAAHRERDTAISTMQQAQQAAQAAAIAMEQAELKASAADTMAKSMAKDVANSLRRAVESDAKNKSLGKELVAAQKAAADIEASRQKDALLVGLAKDAATQLQRQVAQLEAMLATERSASVTLNARIAQLDQQVGEQQRALATLQQQADDVAFTIEEYEAQAEALNDKITDLESNISVNNTAHSASISEVKANAHAAISAARSNAQNAIAQAKEQATSALSAAQQQAEAMRLAEQSTIAAVRAELLVARANESAAVDASAAMQASIASLESQLAKTTELLAATKLARQQTDESISTLEQDLKHAQAHSQESVSREERDQFIERATQAELTVERLQAKIEASELAVGKAFALERQLDEALHRLARFERGKPLDYAGSISETEQISGLQAELATARQNLRQVQDELDLKGSQIKVAFDELAIAHKLTREAQEEVLLNSTERLKTVEELASHKLLQAQLTAQLVAVTEQLRHAHTAHQEMHQTHQELTATIASRPDSDETERLRRQLENLQGECKRLQALLKVSDEELSVLRSGTDVHRSRTSNGFDEAERTAQAPELSRYEATTAELAAVRKELSIAKEQLEQAVSAATGEDEVTAVRGGLPPGFLENLSVLEESIDSLRANLRSAGDETSMMQRTQAVGVVANAISQAIEDVSRARRAMRDIAAIANHAANN